MADVAAHKAHEKADTDEAFRSPLRPLPNGLGFAGLAGSRAAVDSLTFLDLPESLSDGEEHSYYHDEQEDSAVHNRKVSGAAQKLFECEDKQSKEAAASSQNFTSIPNAPTQDVAAEKPKPKQPTGPPPAHLLKKKESAVSQQETSGPKAVSPRPVGWIGQSMFNVNGWTHARTQVNGLASAPLTPSSGLGTSPPSQTLVFPRVTPPGASRPLTPGVVTPRVTPPGTVPPAPAQHHQAAPQSQPAVQQQPAVQPRVVLNQQQQAAVSQQQKAAIAQQQARQAMPSLLSAHAALLGRHAAAQAFAQQAATQQQNQQPSPSPQLRLVSTPVPAVAPHPVSSVSTSGQIQTGKAMAAYADHELQRFVKKLRLSKETEEALRSLDPETMLGIMVEQNPPGNDPTKNKAKEIEPNEEMHTNVDGAEDVVVMARVRRAKLDAEDRAAAAAKAGTSATFSISGSQLPEMPAVVTAQVAQERLAKMLEESARGVKPAAAEISPVASTASASIHHGNDTKDDDPDGIGALIQRFASENKLAIAVERRLKELPKPLARQVMDSPGSPAFQVKSSFRDPNAEVMRRIDLAISPELSKEMKEIDAKIQEKINRKISTKLESMIFEQEITAFIGKYNLSKEIGKSLSMLPTFHARDIMTSFSGNSNVWSSDEKSKEDFLLGRVKKVDKQAYGYIMAYKAAAAAASTLKKIDKDKPPNNNDKRLDDKKRPTEPNEPRSTFRREKSRSRSKRKRSREQQRRSRSLRRRTSRSAKRRERSPPRRKRDRSRSRSRSISWKRNRLGKSHMRRNSPSNAESRKRYKRDATKSKSRSLSKKRKSTAPQTQVVKAVPETRAMAHGSGHPNYKDLLKRLYEEYNPGKISSVDFLLKKYSGQEADMYKRVCRKYGVAPALDGGRHRKLEDRKASEEAFSDADGLDEDTDQAVPVEEIKQTHAESEIVSNEVAIVTAASTNIVPPENLSEDERATWDWLRGLDNGNGVLCRYFDVLRREFDADFSQIAAAKLPTPISPGSLGCIDPSFFEVLGVTSAGHRLLLAKAICALPS